MRSLGAFLLVTSLFVTGPAMAESDPLCEIYYRVKLGEGKIKTLNALGEPYNQSFEIKTEHDKSTQYKFELDKEKFVELYLNFDANGKLNSKNIAGSFCPDHDQSL